MILIKLAVCFMLLWRVEVSTGKHCTSPLSSALKFSVVSRRNHTGHWTAQVQLEHGAEHKEAGPWKVDIEHNTANCGHNESVFILATVTAPPHTPGPDYKLIPGQGYYKFHNTPKSWFDAQRTCTLEGGHLAVINTEEELKGLIKMWSSAPQISDNWTKNVGLIGVHDEDKEGEFKTIFNEPLSSVWPIKWGTNEPQGGRGENCVGLDCGIEKLFDISCTFPLRFFCEWGI